MGMDLIPRKRDLEGLHFNWTGWSIFGDLLEDLGCDLSEMSGSNDGNLIKAVTCRKWAKVLKESLNSNRIKTITEPNKSYYGGFREKFQLDSGADLSQDDKAWIKNIVNFLENCSGCRQF